MQSMTTRKPKGYVGINHTTRGGDILAVLQTIHLPEQTLGPELAARLKKVQLALWYPISDFLEMLERLDQKLGSYHLRQVGWNIFNRYHAEAVRNHVKSARQLLDGFNTMYLEGNRGTQIGGWKVLSFETGRAEVEKATPHHCHMEEGIVAEALRAVGVPAQVSQSKCFRRGDDVCVFVIETTCRDARWSGQE